MQKYNLIINFFYHVTLKFTPHYNNVCIYVNMMHDTHLPSLFIIIIKLLISIRYCHIIIIIVDVNVENY